MSHIRVLQTDGLTEIVLDRPKVNAQNGEMLRELGAAFDAAAEDPSVRGLLLRAEGRCFSAGLDLREVAGLDAAGLDSFLDAFEGAYRSAFRFPKPMAAAIHSHCIAGGLILPLAADFVALGDGDYKVGLTELQVGIPFPRVAWEIVRLALPSRGLRALVQTGPLVGPAEAFELGVGDVVAPAPVAACREWLAVVMSRPLRTFCAVKAMDRREGWLRTEELAPLERPALAALVGSDEVRTALTGVL